MSRSLQTAKHIYQFTSLGERARNASTGTRPQGSGPRLPAADSTPGGGVGGCYIEGRSVTGSRDNQLVLYTKLQLWYSAGNAEAHRPTRRVLTRVRTTNPTLPYSRTRAPRPGKPSFLTALQLPCLPLPWHGDYIVPNSGNRRWKPRQDHQHRGRRLDQQAIQQAVLGPVDMSAEHRPGMLQCRSSSGFVRHGFHDRHQ